MNDVEWFTFTEGHTRSEYFDLAKQTISLPLIPVFPELVKEYNVRQSHTRCPAFIETLSNTFLVRSDINIDLRFDPVTRVLDVRDNTEKTTSFYVVNRDTDNYPDGTNVVEKGNISFSILQQQIFLSKEDIELELLPCLYHESDFTKKTQLIVGKFNINKWVRPTEIAALVNNTSYRYKEPVEISIKRGDPLMYIRFNAKNKKPIRLKQITNEEEIQRYLKLASRCVFVKKILPGLSLQKMYDMFEPFRPRIKKCPFSWRNK